MTEIPVRTEMSHRNGGLSLQAHSEAAFRLKKKNDLNLAKQKINKKNKNINQSEHKRDIQVNSGSDNGYNQKIHSSLHINHSDRLWIEQVCCLAVRISGKSFNSGADVTNRTLKRKAETASCVY